MSTLVFKATRPQAEFLAITSPYKAFTGGFGSGKTHTICVANGIEIHHGPIQNCILAPTFRMLRAVLFPRMQEYLHSQGIGFTATITPMEITTLDPRLGNITFLSLEDPNKLRSYEFYRMHIDEGDTLGPQKAEEAWNLAIGRCRQELETYNVDNAYNQVSWYTTPEGFGFTYKRWVTQKNKDYQMVQASSYSNPFLPRSYIENIKNTYPEQLAKAYIDGEFVNLTSGSVYRSYTRKACSSNESVKAKEPIFVGMDFNIDHMAATIYVKREAKHESPMKNVTVWHAVDEIAEAYDTAAVIAILKARYTDNMIHVYPDSSGKNRSTASGSGAAESDIALLEQAGLRCRYNNSNPKVKDRVSAMNNALEKGLVKINADRCPTVVDCLEQQSYDTSGAPDKKSGKDHQNDATTYVIAYEMPISKPALNIPVSFTL